MSITDYFYSQFVWHLRNISIHNIIMCGYLFAGGFLVYLLFFRFGNYRSNVRRQRACEENIPCKEKEPVESRECIASRGKGKKQSAGEIVLRGICFGLLAAYLYMVFHFTVFVRSAYSEPHYTLELFWSYKLALQGSKGLLVEIILNCIMLIPEGILLPVVLPMKKRSVKFWLTSLLGLLTTCAIELMQLFLRRGLFEFDDIINNFIGILAGYLFYFVISVVRRKMIAVRAGQVKENETKIVCERKRETKNNE